MNDAPAALLGPRDFMVAMDSLDNALLRGPYRRHPERRKLLARARRLDRAGQEQLGPNGSPVRLAEAVAAILLYREELTEGTAVAQRLVVAADAARVAAAGEA